MNSCSLAVEAQYTLIVTHQHAKPHSHRGHDHKGQKVGDGPIPENPHPFPKVTGILLPLISLWNYPPLQKLTTPYHRASLTSLCLWTVFLPWINLLSLYCGSLLNSFLCKTNNPQLAAIPWTWTWPGMWPSILSCPTLCLIFNFLCLMF